MKEKKSKTILKKITHLFSSLLLASKVKPFGEVYKVLKGDTVSVPTEALLGSKQSKPFPDQGQSIYTLTVNSTTARIAETQELYSQVLSAPNCKASRFVGNYLYLGCGNKLSEKTFKDGVPTAGGYDVNVKEGIDILSIAGVKFDEPVFVSFDENQVVRIWSKKEGQFDSATFDQSGISKKLDSLNIEINRKDPTKIVVYQKQTQGANSNIIVGDISKKVYKSLDIASKFPTTLAGINGLQIGEEGNLYVSYQSTEGKLVLATCSVSWDNPDLTDCKIINFPSQFLSDAAYFTLNSQNKYAFFYTKSTQTISRCELEDVNFINCLSTEAKIHLEEGMQLQGINSEDQGSNTGSASAVFSSKAGYSFIFNFRFKFGKLAFEQINSNVATQIVSSGVTGFVWSDKIFSVYGNSKNGVITPYLTFSTNDLKDEFNYIEIKNNDGHNPESTKVVQFRVMADISSVSGISPVPGYQGFIDGNIKKLGISRGLVFGNNLNFEISGAKETFEIYNFNQVNFDVSALGNKFWFTCPHHGVALKGETLYRFDCAGSPHTNGGETCTLNENVQFPLAADQNVIYVNSNEFSEEDGIVVVTSTVENQEPEKNSVNFIYLGVKEEDVFSTSLKKTTIKEGGVFFKVTGKLYTFWVTRKNKGNEVIELWSVYNKEFAAMPHSPYGRVNYMTFNSGFEFCPIDVQKSPLTATHVNVISQCEGGENRVYSLYTTNVTNIKVLGSRSLANVQISQGTYQTCTFGNEILVFNPTSKNLFLTSTGPGISFSNINWNLVMDSLDGIHCARNTQSAVITGKKGEKQVLSIIFGNRMLDQVNRIHTVTEYQGEIQRVVDAENGGILITIKNGDQFTFHKAYLNGPMFLFNAKNSAEGEQKVNLKISSQGKELATQEFTLSLKKFNSEVTVGNDTTVNANSGVYDFFHLATVTGPIFNSSISGGKNVALTPRLVQDGSYVKQINGSFNIPEPDRIHNDGGFYSVGIRKSKLSLLAYYYQNRDQHWYIQDLGYYSTAYDVAFSGDDYAIFALATSEGGEYHIRWVIKNFKTGKVNDGRAVSDVYGNKVSISAIGIDQYLVVVVDDRSQNAGVYRFNVKADGDTDFTLDSAKVLDPIENINLVQTVGLQNSAVLFYTNPETSNTIIALKYNGTFARSYITSINLPSTIQITDFRCKVFSGKPNCFALNNQNIIAHLTLAYRSSTNSLKLISKNAYSYYKDFLPDRWDFNEDYLVTRARNTEKEIMLVYQISKNYNLENSQQIWWGLSIQDYYNPVDSKVTTTTSIPFVFKSAEGHSAIRFTQNQLFGHFNGNHSVMRAYKAEGSLLVLKEGLSENEAGDVTVSFADDANAKKTANIGDFFAGWADPSNKSGDFGGIPTIVWVLVAIGVLLLIVIVCIRSGGAKEEYEEDGENSYYEEGDYTELDRGEDEKVAISESKIKKMTA